MKGDGGGDGTKTLWVLRGATPTPVAVKVGLTDGTQTEVLSGDVKEGDALILEATSSDEPAPASGTKAPGGGSGGPRMRL
jgi:HlyD family secretion protein